jgi:hypothetical protein
MWEGEAVIVDLDTRKWGDRPHYRMNTELLGHDEHGAWLGLPVGSPYSGPNGAGELEHGFVGLIPEDSWWIASFWAGHPETDVYVDITTTAIWKTESHLVVVDLDLDVIRYRDGRTELVDEDEFEEHRVVLGYPVDVVDQARATAEEMLSLVAGRREPFDEVGRRWLMRLPAQLGTLER